jgi:hypothetical protein
MPYSNLGIFEATESVTLHFQFIDSGGDFAAPTSPPIYRVYNSAGALVGAGPYAMTVSTPAGHYFGVLDLTAELITTVGRYTIQAYVPAVGEATYAFYTFDLVAAGSNYVNFTTDITDLSDKFAGVTTIEQTIEDTVWDSDPADHSAGNTFGARTFTEQNIGDVLSALSVDVAYTVGNDLATLAADLVTSKLALVGRWKIDTIAKTLTMYEADQVTPLVVFELFNPSGDPATTNVAERVPQ